MGPLKGALRITYHGNAVDGSFLFTFFCEILDENV
jgi:hypothetical protein